MNIVNINGRDRGGKKMTTERLEKTEHKKKWKIGVRNREVVIELVGKLPS